MVRNLTFFGPAHLAGSRRSRFRAGGRLGAEGLPESVVGIRCSCSQKRLRVQQACNGLRKILWLVSESRQCRPVKTQCLHSHTVLDHPGMQAAASSTSVRSPAPVKPESTAMHRRSPRRGRGSKAMEDGPLILQDCWSRQSHLPRQCTRANWLGASSRAKAGTSRQNQPTASTLGCHGRARDTRRCRHARCRGGHRPWMSKRERETGSPLWASRNPHGAGPFAILGREGESTRLEAPQATAASIERAPGCPIPQPPSQLRIRQTELPWP